jgi:hypothetical protein
VTCTLSSWSVENLIDRQRRVSTGEGMLVVR